MTFKEILKRELKYLPMWYVLCSGIQLFIQMVQNYDMEGLNHPHEFIVFGPGVLLTVLFPILWFLIYVFCRQIATKNKMIKALEEKLKTRDETL